MGPNLRDISLPTYYVSIKLFDKHNQAWNGISIPGRSLNKSMQIILAKYAFEMKAIISHNYNKENDIYI
jgi:hypothetical protein